MGKPTDLWSFARALLGGTWSRMGGGAGVALSVASPFVPAEDGKLGVELVAGLCFLASIYLTWRTERRRANDLASQVAGQGRLEIEFRPGQTPFEEVRGHRLYDQARRIFSIRVRNVGGSTVFRCRLTAVSIEPFDGMPDREIVIFPRPMEAPIDLHAGEGFVRALASYLEAGPHMPAATMGNLHVFLNPDEPRLGDRTLGREHPFYKVTLRATADGSAPAEMTFQIWFSQTPHLRMKVFQETPLEDDYRGCYESAS